MKQVMRLSLYTLFIAALGTVSTAYAAASKTELPKQASAEGSRVYIISPADGEIVGRKFTVKFGLQGMGVAPAGVDKPNTGHHHLLIDMNTLPDLNQPMAGAIKHFGGGQTETVLELEPGEHRLQLILGDKFHIPHKPAVISEPITVIVQD